MSVQKSNICDEFITWFERLLKLREKYPDWLKVNLTNGFLTFIVLKAGSTAMEVVNKVESMLKEVLNFLMEKGKNLSSLKLKFMGKDILGLDIKHMNSALID